MPPLKATVLAHVHDTHDDMRATWARVSEAEAMLSLVRCRLHDLGRVLRGELDPWLLSAPHNVVDPDAMPTNHGEDVVLARADVRPSRPARHPRP